MNTLRSKCNVNEIAFNSAALKVCCAGWESEARLLGNLKAKEIEDIADGVFWLIARVRELEEENTRLKTETYCAYCGKRFPLDDRAAALVTEHIYTCEKHPLTAEIKVLREEVKKLEAVIEYNFSAQTNVKPL